MGPEKGPYLVLFGWLSILGSLFGVLILIRHLIFRVPKKVPLIFGNSQVGLQGRGFYVCLGFRAWGCRVNGLGFRVWGCRVKIKTLTCFRARCAARV